MKAESTTATNSLCQWQEHTPAGRRFYRSCEYVEGLLLRDSVPIQYTWRNHTVTAQEISAAENKMVQMVTRYTFRDIACQWMSCAEITMDLERSPKDDGRKTSGHRTW
jgi:hypothetical protein